MPLKAIQSPSPLRMFRDLKPKGKESRSPSRVTNPNCKGPAVESQPHKGIGSQLQRTSSGSDAGIATPYGSVSVAATMGSRGSGWQWIAALSGWSVGHQQSSQPSVASSLSAAVHLLQSVPPAREAVLEYFTLILVDTHRAWRASFPDWSADAAALEPTARGQDDAQLKRKRLSSSLASPTWENKHGQSRFAIESAQKIEQELISLVTHVADLSSQDKVAASTDWLNLIIRWLMETFRQLCLDDRLPDSIQSISAAVQVRQTQPVIKILLNILAVVVAERSPEWLQSVFADVCRATVAMIEPSWLLFHVCKLLPLAAFPAIHASALAALECGDQVTVAVLLQVLDAIAATHPTSCITATLTLIDSLTQVIRHDASSSLPDSTVRFVFPYVLLVLSSCVQVSAALSLAILERLQPADIQALVREDVRRSVSVWPSCWQALVQDVSPSGQVIPLLEKTLLRPKADLFTTLTFLLDLQILLDVGQQSDSGNTILKQAVEYLLSALSKHVSVSILSSISQPLPLLPDDASAITSLQRHSTTLMDRMISQVVRQYQSLRVNAGHAEAIASLSLAVQRTSLFQVLSFLVLSDTVEVASELASRLLRPLPVQDEFVAVVSVLPIFVQTWMTQHPECYARALTISLRHAATLSTDLCSAYLGALEFLLHVRIAPGLS